MPLNNYEGLFQYPPQYFVAFLQKNKKIYVSYCDYVLICAQKIDVATQTKHHFSSIDLLRGMAALTVAFYHYTGYFLPTTHPLNFMFARGYIGVQTFFVISGLVIPYSLAQKDYSIRQIGTQFVSRALRIEGAYWASIILVMLIDKRILFSLPQYWQGLGWYSTFLHFFHLNAIMHEPWLREIYWTLAIDWQFYLCALLTFPILNRSEWWVRYPLYVLFALRFWGTPFAWLPYHLSAFGSGIMLFHYYRGYMGKIELAITLIAMLAWHHRYIEFPLLAGTALPVLIILFVKADWAWTRFIGKTSYSFYLTHIMGGWIVMEAAAMIDKTNGWFMGAMVFVAIGVSLVFANYFYKWIEEPTLQWSKNWGNWVKKRNNSV
jgi:peptidoglycan/LPS O-acetylase OafA/YrhL